MKLSMFTIAATLAAIAGNVIAAPGPLHPRALEDANTFEGNSYLYRRLLDYVEHHQQDHLQTGRALKDAKLAHRRASKDAKGAAYVEHWRNQLESAKRWEDLTKHHAAMAVQWRTLGKAHKRAAKDSQKTELHQNVEWDRQQAGTSKANAERTSEEASDIIRHILS